MFSSDLISFSFLLKSDLILIRLDLSPFFQFSSVLNWLFRISSFLFHFLRLFSFSLGFDVAFAIRSIRLIGCSRIIIITIIVIISISICVACRYVELWFMSMNLTWTVIQDCLIVRNGFGNWFWKYCNLFYHLNWWANWSVVLFCLCLSIFCFTGIAVFLLFCNNLCIGSWFHHI